MTFKVLSIVTLSSLRSKRKLSKLQRMLNNLLRISWNPRRSMKIRSWRLNKISNIICKRKKKRETKKCSDRKKWWWKAKNELSKLNQSEKLFFKSRKKNTTERSKLLWKEFIWKLMLSKTSEKNFTQT